MTRTPEQEEPARAHSPAGGGSGADGEAGSIQELDSGPRPFSWFGDGDVLLAEDEPVVRQVSGRALERLGLTVTACANGRDAVEIFSAAPARWRLVVLDLTMPVIAGDEALERIIEIRPGMPVLLYSGYAEEDVMHRFSGHRHVSFLSKPFSVRALSDAVRLLLGPPDREYP